MRSTKVAFAAWLAVPQLCGAFVPAASSCAQCIRRTRAVRWSTTEEVEPQIEQMTAQQRMAALLGKTITDDGAAARAREVREEEARQEKRRNLGIAVASFLSTATIFFAQHGFSEASANPVALLRTMEGQSPPLQVALSNGKPTVLEFYAEWCENCKEMAPTMQALEKVYDGRVNFVVIDGDSRKNGDLVGAFRVDGIPHVAMVTSGGDVQTALIGNVPRKILDADISALIQKKELPFVGYDAFEGGSHNVRNIFVTADE